MDILSKHQIEKNNIQNTDLMVIILVHKNEF